MAVSSHTKAIALGLVLIGLGFGLWRAAAAFGEPWQHGWLAHNGGRYSLAGRNFERDILQRAGRTERLLHAGHLEAGSHVSVAPLTASNIHPGAA